MARFIKSPKGLARSSKFKPGAKLGSKPKLAKVPKPPKVPKIF